MEEAYSAVIAGKPLGKPYLLITEPSDDGISTYEIFSISADMFLQPTASLSSAGYSSVGIGCSTSWHEEPIQPCPNVSNRCWNVVSTTSILVHP